MTLPDRLTYEEVRYGDDEWGPEVRCTECDWTYDAEWAELGDDEFGADWDALHPAIGHAHP